MGGAESGVRGRSPRAGSKGCSPLVGGSGGQGPPGASAFLKLEGARRDDFYMINLGLGSPHTAPNIRNLSTIGTRGTLRNSLHDMQWGRY